MKALLAANAVIILVAAVLVWFAVQEHIQGA